MGETGRTRWHVCRGDGTRIRLSEAGLLIGRAPDCQIGILDPRVSSRHALLSLTQDGPELIVFGRNPVMVDGQLAPRVQRLERGARVLLASEELVLEATGEGPSQPSSWIFQSSPTIVHAPCLKNFTLGSGPDDTLQIASWPVSAVRCNVVQGALLLTPTVPVKVAGVQVARGELVSACNGDRLEYRGTGFTLFRQISSESGTTDVERTPEPVHRIRFSYLPNGGLLELEFSDRSTRLHLSELRCNLMAVLVGAHREHVAGEAISDDELVRLLWPNNFDRTNLHLNQVLHRLRHTLIKAGVDPYRVLDRPKGAGYTRLRIDSGTRVELL